MNHDDPADYLTVTAADEQCVWCHATVPAGHPIELMVAHLDRRWWSCPTCSTQARHTDHHNDYPEPA